MLTREPVVTTTVWSANEWDTFNTYTHFSLCILIKETVNIVTTLHDSEVCTQRQFTNDAIRYKNGIVPRYSKEAIRNRDC